MKPTQCERIVDYMKQFGSINPVEAMRDIGCMRLAARINDLRKEGVKIKSTLEFGKNRFGGKCHWKRYSLVE